ncbi:hypothetical protein PIROE2DRAFT_64727 [Piromyces sp. E2]|nr:hypothetical protein PIROE2DRAFT_64727 [Piromyces sp. E2]|eukprot:OUM57919.1 hypothetical protein PIROE2DRAFT_64727 [Piromyces sp. E2]
MIKSKKSVEIGKNQGLEINNLREQMNEEKIRNEKNEKDNKEIMQILKNCNNYNAENNSEISKLKQQLEEYQVVENRLKEMTERQEIDALKLKLREATLIIKEKTEKIEELHKQLGKDLDEKSETKQLLDKGKNVQQLKELPAKESKIKIEQTEQETQEFRLKRVQGELQRKISEIDSLRHQLERIHKKDQENNIEIRNLKYQLVQAREREQQTQEKIAEIVELKHQNEMLQ